MAKFNEYPVKAKPADANTFYFIKSYQWSVKSVRYSHHKYVS